MRDDIRETQFGFVYGPVQVVRMFNDKRGALLGFMGPGDSPTSAKGIHTQIWVSAKGRSVRVHRGGKELK